MGYHDIPSCSFAPATQNYHQLSNRLCSEQEVPNYSLMPRGDQRLGATAMVILMPTLQQSHVFQPLDLVASGHEAAWQFQAGLCCDGGPRR